MINKLKRILNEYTELSIFSVPEFRQLATFDWNVSITSITDSYGTYHTHEEVLENIRGTFFPSASFRINPFNIVAPNLNGEQREERQRARAFIRKIFLEKDGCSIESALEQLFDYDLELKEWIMNWIDGGWAPSIAVSTEKLPAGYRLDKLYKKRNITAAYLDDTGALSPMDLYMLYIYGNLIHEDDDKKILYDICIEELGERFFNLIDMQMVVIYEISLRIILPCIKGYELWKKRQASS